MARHTVFVLAVVAAGIAACVSTGWRAVVRDPNAGVLGDAARRVVERACAERPARCAETNRSSLVYDCGDCITVHVEENWPGDRDAGVIRYDYGFCGVVRASETEIIWGDLNCMASCLCQTDSKDASASQKQHLSKRDGGPQVRY